MMNGGSMSEAPIVITAALGQNVAAVTGQIDGRPTAVINTRARADPAMYNQATWALLCAGVDAAHTMGALDGVRR